MGCLILLVGFIILFAVFAIKLPEIKTALEETRFIDLVKQRVTTTTSAPAPAPQNKPVPATPAPSGARPKTPSAETPTPAAPATTSQTIPSQAIPSPGASIPATTLSETAPTAQKPASPSAPAASRMAALFFVKIEEDGTISRQEVKRAVPASDVPLTDALNALFAGPSEAEIRSGLVSLIPRGTKLLGATVRGSTATINLSEAFMYNRYAVEGYSAQLRQIVYTATAFTSIQDVQFLVEGKQKDYLGGEGVYIGKPLSRNSF